jgi:uncharacterized Tic20 family protein
VWISKADDSKVYDAHGRAVVNFHLSITLYFILSLLVFFVLPGFNFFITGFIVLFSIIVTVRNIMSSLEHGTCKYPLAISFLKPKAA